VDDKVEKLGYKKKMGQEKT